MSTNRCYVCGRPVHGHGLCVKHYRRKARRGNPYTVGPQCPVCVKVARILRRPAVTERELLEQFADLYLLFQTGSDYRLKDYDTKGRAYDLEEGLTRA